VTSHVTRITLLTQPDCAFCGHAKEVIARVGEDYPLSVAEVDLGTEEGRRLATSGGVLFAPGVLVNDQPFGYGRLSERRLRKEIARQVLR
jgi:glutaredoxin